MNVVLNWGRAIAGQWRLLSASLVAAAIVHILITLSSAQFAEATSYKVLSENLPVNRVAFGKPVTAAAQPLPFFGPDALYSFCRYDASTTRIRVSAKLPDVGWSLSLHTPRGENFYFVPGNGRRSTDIDLILVPPGNVFSHGNIEVNQSDKTIPRINLPHVRGLVILRAPVKGLAYRRQIDEQRGAFRCQAQNTARRLR